MHLVFPDGIGLAVKNICVHGTRPAEGSRRVRFVLTAGWGPGYTYQQWAGSEECSTGFAGEFNRTTCGYTVACTRKCKSELKYICK